MLGASPLPLSRIALNHHAMCCELSCTEATDALGFAPIFGRQPGPLLELRAAPRQEALGKPRSCEIALPLERLRAARFVLSDGLFGQLRQLVLRLSKRLGPALLSRQLLQKNGSYGILFRRRQLGNFFQCLFEKLCHLGRLRRTHLTAGWSCGLTSTLTRRAPGEVCKARRSRARPCAAYC